ncbi:hypothetical protein ABG768_013474 [Culter alburnus]|uniref:Chemokine interleukin-8-like domain-containing protein n=1 Tax=Culter alburnus TaxID=194366 RepID=A0AAW2B4Z1_CULAL
MMSRLVLTSSKLLLLLCVWVTLSQSSPVRCCTKYSSQPFPVNRLKDFTLQDSTMTCNIEAVMFLWHYNTLNKSIQQYTWGR